MRAAHNVRPLEEVMRDAAAWKGSAAQLVEAIMRDPTQDRDIRLHCAAALMRNGDTSANKARYDVGALTERERTVLRALASKLTGAAAPEVTDDPGLAACLAWLAAEDDDEEEEPPAPPRQSATPRPAASKAPPLALPAPNLGQEVRHPPISAARPRHGSHCARCDGAVLWQSRSAGAEPMWKCERCCPVPKSLSEVIYLDTEAMKASGADG
jgi:hypothetical protein